MTWDSREQEAAVILWEQVTEGAGEKIVELDAELAKVEDLAGFPELGDIRAWRGSLNEMLLHLTGHSLVEDGPR